MKKNLFILNTEKISKLLLFILIIYEGWYLEKFNPIPYFLQILTILFIFFAALYALKKRISILNSISVTWILFLISCLIGLFFSKGRAYGFSSLFTFFSFLIVVIFSELFIKENKSSSWLSISIITIAILTGICVLFSPFSYQNGLYFVTTMSSRNNPNGLGFTMALGSFFLLISNKNIRLINFLFRLLISLIFFYITINSGSRSGLICNAVVIVLSLFNQLSLLSRKSASNNIKKMVIILTMIIGVIILGKTVLKTSSGNSGLFRLMDLFNLDFFSGRTNLYVDAWNFFISNPFFGIGYDCFAVIAPYGYYTHSTYMELLSCTGIIGFLLFMFPFFKGVFRSIKIIKIDKGKKIILLIFFFINGFFTIWFYNLIYLIILYSIFKELSFKKDGEYNEQNI